VVSAFQFHRFRVKDYSFQYLTQRSVLISRPIFLRSRESLFTLFFSSKGNKGTGLGLFIAKKSVTRHGGKIKVKTQPNRGATFRVILPRELPESK
jgi:light-regulated signal transduction histidine kinase (bacteriophytochrome)